MRAQPGRWRGACWSGHTEYMLVPAQMGAEALVTAIGAFLVVNSVKAVQIVLL